jgi:quercetin 2,3-dioxygenase
MVADFARNAEMIIPLPPSYNALAYLLEGSIESEGSEAGPLNLAVFEKGGDSVRLRARNEGRLLFLAGEPIEEPVVSYGPFVMNDPAEIREALLDYELGKMGALES